MSKLKNNISRKIIGNKILIGMENEKTVSEIKKIIRDSNYITNGEKLLVVKEVEQCEIILNSDTTNHIIIKALTNVSIKPSKNYIDEYYTDIQINRGACVEFYLLEDNWYIVSSDGLKLD